MILKNETNKKHNLPGIKKKDLINIIGFLLFPCLFFIGSTLPGCRIYKFNEAGTIPDSIKTVKINYIENRAQYINPQLSPKLTDKLRQKVISQTRLSQTSSDNADWDISGFVTSYSFSTSAISGQQVATNRLTVAIHIILNDRKADDKKEYDVSRSFEFKGTQSFQQAEASLSEELVRTLTDEIFNKLFSNW